MIGIDAVDIERLRRTFDRAPQVERRLFTDAERGYCRARSDPLRHFAGTLAAKEAVIKASGLGTLVAWGRRIEVRRDAEGAPRVTIRGGSDAPIHVSISHDGSLAVAIAVAQRDMPRHHGEGVSRVTHDVDGVDRSPKPRRNEQLARYMGMGSRTHNPYHPPIPTLTDVSVEGSDFP